MTDKIIIDTDIHLVRQTWQGLLGLDEIFAHCQALVAHPQFRPGMNCLTDLRQATSDLRYDDLYQLQGWLGQLADYQLGRWAFVTEDPLMHGLTRMLAGLLDQHYRRAQVFATPEQALAWLQSLQD